MMAIFNLPRALTLSLCFGSAVFGFTPTLRISLRRKDQKSLVGLDMAKKLRNKQADLAAKMAALKKEKSEKPEGSKTKRSTDEELKEQNDRLRFDELLKTQSTSLNSVSSDGYLSREQEDEEINAFTKGADRLFEGDPAPTQPFEELVSVDGNVLGEAGAAGLVPWLKKSSSDYLIIISDPRVKSEELRDTVKNLSNEMPKDMLSRTVIINADTPPENRRWLKKNKIKNINFYSDEERELMRSYTALGENRWSMTMFVIADSRVQKIARELETIMANKVIQNAVRSMENRRL